MKTMEAYAILAARNRRTQEQVDNLSEETIGAAARDYIQQHPDVLEDALGIHKDQDGRIFQRARATDG